MQRIAAAPKSSVQAEALAQAQLIGSDCARSESQISRIAATRRQQIGSYFSGARRGLSDFFTRSVAAVQTFISGKQAEIAAAVTGTLAWIRTAITGALQAAQTLAGQVRARINQMLEGISTSVQSRVAGIAGEITGLIDSIPLPDIPGIGRIRAAAVSLLNRAAGLVKGAVGRLADFVGWAFGAGMDLLDSILGTIAQWLDTALSLAESAILSAMQTIAQELNRAVALIGSALQQALLAICLPILNTTETLIVNLIGSVEQRALALLRANREEHLAALAEAVAPGAGAREPTAASAGSPVAAMQQLGRDASRNNRLIVQTFEALTGAGIASIIRLVAAAAARTVAGIAALVARAVQSVASAVIQAIQDFARLAQAIGKFVGELIRSSVDTLRGLVEYIRSPVQGGGEKLIQFAQNGLSRIGGFIGRFVQNMILGRGLSASLEDAIGEFSLAHSLTGPAPVLSFLGPAPAYAGGPILIIGGLVVIIIGGLSVVLPLWLAIVIVVVVILLLILLIYLIWRWLKPKPPPGKRVIRVTPSVLELGVGGRDIAGAATIAPGVPARPPLTWTINPGGPAPAGVSVIGSGQSVKVRAAHPPHGTVVGGTPITVRAALTADPADFADSAPVMMVQVVSATYAAVPPLANVPALGGPYSPPPNTAEPNRDGIAGNTAVVNATTAPATRPIAVAFRRSLGARVAGTTITLGRTTGDIGLRITDTATAARLDETQPSTSGPATLMADMTVNAVPLRVRALTFAGLNPPPYGVNNRITFAESDTLHSPLTRVVGELITHVADDFNLPPPNGAFNPIFQLNLAVPANAWVDQLFVRALTLSTVDGRPAIDVNRFVGPGAPGLPRRLIYRQRFQYSSWQGAGTVVSNTFADGQHIKLLTGSPPAAFQFSIEHRFGGVSSKPPAEPYAGPPLIVLSGMSATPNPVPAGTASTTVSVNVAPAGRTINWSVDAAAAAAGVTVVPNVTAPGPNPRVVTVTRPAGFTGTVTVTAVDSVFPARTSNVRARFR